MGNHCICEYPKGLDSSTARGIFNYFLSLLICDKPSAFVCIPPIFLLGNFKFLFQPVKIEISDIKTCKRLSLATRFEMSSLSRKKKKSEK